MFGQNLANQRPRHRGIVHRTQQILQIAQPPQIFFDDPLAIERRKEIDRVAQFLEPFAQFVAFVRIEIADPPPHF